MCNRSINGKELLNSINNKIKPQFYRFKLIGYFNEKPIFKLIKIENRG